MGGRACASWHIGGTFGRDGRPRLLDRLRRDQPIQVTISHIAGELKYNAARHRRDLGVSALGAG